MADETAVGIVVELIVICGHCWGANRYRWQFFRMVDTLTELRCRSCGRVLDLVPAKRELEEG